MNIQKNNLRCGHIYSYSANCRVQNSVILIGINALRNSVWGQKISPQISQPIKLVPTERCLVWKRFCEVKLCSKRHLIIDNGHFFLPFIKNSLMWPLVCLDWCKTNLNHTKLQISLIIQKSFYSGRGNPSSDKHQQICIFYHYSKSSSWRQVTKLHYLSPFNSAQKWIHFIHR